MSSPSDLRDPTGASAPGPDIPARRPLSLPARAGVILAGAILVGHGLIHLMGVSLMWRLGEPGELLYSDVSPEAGSPAAVLVGAVWLAAALLFVAAGVLLVGRRGRWHRLWPWVALAGSVVSVPVLLPVLSFADSGLLVDVIVILAAGASLVLGRRAGHPGAALRHPVRPPADPDRPTPPTR